MWWWTVQNLVVTALLAALVWLACRLLRIGPATRHALWLVVLLKMLTPPLVAWPWAVGNPDWLSLDGAAAAATPAATPPAVAHPPADVIVNATVAVEVPVAPHVDVIAAPPVEVDATGPVVSHVLPDMHPPMALPPAPLHDYAKPPAGPVALPTPRPVFTAPPPPKVVIAVPSPEPERPRWADWLRTLLGWTWLGGSALFLLIQTIRIVRMRRRLIDSTAADEELQEQVTALAARMGVKPPRVRLVRGLGSPAIFALARPMLLWPTDLDIGARGAVRGLIVHELAHLRRRDHWVGWIELLAGCLWWWNPLFWYARHQLRESAELACDGWVVDVLPGGRRAYAEGLLSVCEFISRRVAPMPAVGVNTGGRRFLERRLAMIMRDQVSLRIPRFGLLTIALLAASALPAWSQFIPTDGSTAERSTPAADATAAAEKSRSVRTTGTLLIGDSPLPPEAQELVSRFQQQQVQSLRDVIQELQGMRTRAIASGNPGAVQAIDRRINQFQQQIAVITAGGFRRSLDTQPDPGTLYNFRDRVGQTFLFEVIGTKDDQPIWGGADGFYTDDSPLALAAVHAGILQPGERGIVRAEICAGRPSYTGSTANGVTTRDYLTWGGSYRISRVNGDDNSATPENLTAYRGRVGHIISFMVVGNAEAGTVWGGEDGVYTDDSAVAAAAVHAGVVKDGERGRVRVEILPGRASYAGCTKNGVTSSNYGEWQGSYRILPAGEGGGPVATTPAPTSVSALRGRDGEIFQFEVTGSTSGTVWGGEGGVYTDDSPLGVAAVHAGILRDGQSGVVRVTILPGRDSYPAVTGAGGVTSHAWNSFGGSYKIEQGVVGYPVPRRFVAPRPQPIVPVQPVAPVPPGGAAAPIAPVPNYDGANTVNLTQLRGQNNAVVYVQVTGDTTGTVWGCDIYTDDSSIATAAVHAGIVKPGEKAMVKVKVLPGREEYSACERNGVTTLKYGPWGGSFSLERAGNEDRSTGTLNLRGDVLKLTPQLHNYTRGLEEK